MCINVFHKEFKQKKSVFIHNFNPLIIFSIGSFLYLILSLYLCFFKKKLNFTLYFVEIYLFLNY